MKSTIYSAIKLTLVCMVLFMVVYPLFILGIAQFSNNHGKGEILVYEGKTHYSNIGQLFNQDKYFNSRPSSVSYNAAGSCGSNKGPTNPEYLAEVKARIDTFQIHNPEISKSEIPSELVTASGSGLDPNISIEGALIQVKRIAKVRGLKEVTLLQLIEQQTEKPLLNIIGPSKINVLKLNIELEKISTIINR